MPLSRTKTAFRCTAATVLAFSSLAPTNALSQGTAKATKLYLGSEFNSFSMSGYAQRSGSTFTNLSMNISQRVHPDVWVGLGAFLGHDPSPSVSRNYDQNLGLSVQWFPLTLSIDSNLAVEGFQFNEQSVFKPFALGQVVFGRILLRSVFNDFDASADYIGFALGAGTLYSLYPALSLSGSLCFQKNVGLSKLSYSGQKIALSFGLALNY